MPNQIGFKTVQDLIILVRQFINEKIANYWTDADLLRHINDEQYFLMTRIMQANAYYFTIKGTISLVSGTEEYDLPADFTEMNFVEFASSGGINEDKTILPINFHDKPFLPSNSANVRLSLRRQKYFLRRGKVGFAPKPDRNDTVNIYYSRRLKPLHYGTASAGADTTITLPASATVGDVMQIDDFYNNEKIYIVSGTGVGQINSITDYVGSTRVATVPTWGTNPSSDSVYSFVSEIPPEHHDLLSVGAAIRSLAQATPKTAPKTLTELYTSLYENMIYEVEERQSQEPRYVNYTRYSEDDD